jgi:hypothetical protein
MSATALLVVPPFIKYNAGPLLGPALLQAAATATGHFCTVLDLNAIWIQQQQGHFLENASSSLVAMKPVFQGDHNKPVDSSLLRVERLWTDTILGESQREDHDLLRRVQYGFLDHGEIQAHAARLVASPFGSWMRNQLVQTQTHDSTEIVVGVSLLHAGQVIPAVAISMLARELWPGALVMWGGPHITGLGHAIKDDLDVRKALAADLFVQGHAEETFVNLLHQRSTQSRSPKNSLSGVAKGSRGKFMRCPAIPAFDNLDCYSQPLTLPVQSSLGCAYGKCAFCTYPAMEGTPVQLSLNETVEPAVRRALELGEHKCSGISLKDSLVTTNRLRDIAECVGGRVQWSACTKLSRRLADRNTLRHLTDNGLVTLEVGLESLLPETQRRVGKMQPQALFDTFVSEVSQTSGLSLVVNYMTGFPWEDQEEAHAKLQETKETVEHQLAGRGKIEHNTFELERLSPSA